MQRLPIAIFDSGVGGLTVVSAIRAALRAESIIYLGDTARLPYGTKSAEVVQRYALACGRFLHGVGAKLLVVACNTATAHALSQLQAAMSIPVIGVIEPGAARAIEVSAGRRIGVIATEGTIASASYQRTLARLCPQAQVFTAACPLFVPLAEENMVYHSATQLIAEEYLAPLRAAAIDTLLLGCTHYPLLRPTLQQVCGPSITIVDSAQAVAQAVSAALDGHGLRAPADAEPSQRFFATDVSQRLHRVGSAFLGEAIREVEWVDIPTA